MNINDIVSYLGLEYHGDPIEITGLNTLEEASSTEISFLSNPKYIECLASTKAGAVLVSPHHADNVRNPIISQSPYHDFAKLLHLFHLKEGTFQGISELAYIAPSVRLGSSVTIYPFVYIADDVVIEDEVTIFPHCYIGEGSYIGKQTILYPNVTIMSRTIIEEECVISSGAVIGSDGFGFIHTKEGVSYIPQNGHVTIKSNVSVGANTAIDRATLTVTSIGQGTKIDNLVQVAHNVRIGDYCFIVSQTGISGSSILGNRVITAGQAGIAGHLNIGDGAIIGPKAGIAKDVPAGETRAGMPATNQMTFLRLSHIFPKLPSIIKTISKLEEKVQALEEQLKRSE